MAIPFHFLFFLGRLGVGGVAGVMKQQFSFFFIFGRETAKPPIFALKDITKHI